jgi:hypothetical protein
MIAVVDIDRGLTRAGQEKRFGYKLMNVPRMPRSVC